MIIGIGSDLIDIRRIEKTLEKHGDRFTQRVLLSLSKPSQMAANSVLRLTQSVLPQRKLAPRRLVRVFRMGFSGAIWGGECAFRQADHATDRRSGEAVEALAARR